MRNAEVTKKIIIKESANLFNTKGYKATSISDITTATGFTKGAIYRHFENKQDLEGHALKSLSKLMFDEIGVSIREASTFQSKFDAIFSFFENYMNIPLYEGGCPLLNAAVEADDANPVLRLQVLAILKNLKQSIVLLIDNGIANKQVIKNIDPSYYASIIIATLEGAIMMSRLEQDKTSLNHTIKHLRKVVKDITI